MLQRLSDASVLFIFHIVITGLNSGVFLDISFCKSLNISPKGKESTSVAITLQMSSLYHHHSFHSFCLFLICLVFDPRSAAAGLESVDGHFFFFSFSFFFFKLSDRRVRLESVSEQLLHIC